MPDRDRLLQVLLVEDNPVDVLITRESLKGWRIENDLHVVEDGEQALDFVYKRIPYSQAPQPDLILLDLNLPKKNGKEVLSEIRKDPSLSNIKVIVVTTTQTLDETQDCTDLGAEFCLIKPMGFEEYIEALNSIQEFLMNSHVQ